MQNKLSERERVHNQNRDLVTKNSAQQSTIARLKKEVSDLNQKVQSMSAENEKKT